MVIETTAFEVCPVCAEAMLVRFLPGWHDGSVLPIVGCGNPWHYIFPEQDVIERLRNKARLWHENRMLSDTEWASAIALLAIESIEAIVE